MLKCKTSISGYPFDTNLRLMIAVLNISKHLSRARGYTMQRQRVPRYNTGLMLAHHLQQ